MRKINRFSIYLTLFLALFLQAGIANNIRIFGARPDLILMSVVFFGLFSGAGAGFESGIVAGAMADILALDFFGINMITLAATGLMAGMVSEKFFKESKRMDFILVTAFSVFSMALHYAFVAVFSKSAIISFRDFFTSSVVPAAIYTGLASIPVFPALIRIFNLRELEEYL